MIDVKDKILEVLMACGKNPKAAAEKAAATVWELSDREKEIIKKLSE